LTGSCQKAASDRAQSESPAGGKQAIPAESAHFTLILGKRGFAGDNLLVRADPVLIAAPRTRTAR